MSTVDSVFVDESGYTGADLLNTEQRVQAVAAVRCSKERAKELVDTHFGAVRAPELKLSRLVKRGTHRKALVAAMLGVSQNLEAVGYVYCKRYALWLNLLNDCVEPVCDRTGAPFYENGWNQSFASILQFTSKQFWGQERTDRILAAYQRAARSRSPEDARALLGALQDIRGCELAEHFTPAMNGDPGVLAALQDPRGTLDMSLPMVVGLVSWLEERSAAPYRIVHDNNKAIGKSLDMFRALADIEISKNFKVSSITMTSFPLKFSEAVMADSRDDLRLQLADLLAGSVRLCTEMILGFKPNDGLPDELLVRLPEESFIFNVASPDLVDTRSTFHGSQGGQLIDFLAREFAKRDIGSNAPPQA